MNNVNFHITSPFNDCQDDVMLSNSIIESNLMSGIGSLPMINHFKFEFEFEIVYIVNIVSIVSITINHQQCFDILRI
jgi:hypothetical protein